MKSIRIVQKFFSKEESVGAASYQRAKAKRDKVVILKVEKIDAYELYKMNGWFKKNPFEKLGIPTPGQFMIIVHYNYNVVAVKKTSVVKKKIVAASKKKNVGKKFKIVKLNESQKQQVQAKHFGSVSNNALPIVRFRYRMMFTVGKLRYNSISFTPPTYRCQAAA